jgi:AraC-like DNA-binding protein
VFDIYLSTTGGTPLEFTSNPHNYFHLRPKEVISDMENFGKRTRFLVVKSREKSALSWQEGSPVCEILGMHSIKHVGIMDAYPPFEIVREKQSGTYMMVCLEGEGLIYVDGVWKKLRKGQACLLPPFVMNSFKCCAGKRWKFAWVRYEESRNSKPVVSILSPVIRNFGSEGLECAIRGLFAATTENMNAALPGWCDLINLYVRRFAEPVNPDDRLRRVWMEVEKNPGYGWTLAELAGLAFLSTEHLRRLCLSEIGRTPMRHLTFIRLQIALRLLTTSDDKIETIARDVGFAGIHGFSNSFKTCFGKRPSDFRIGAV